jgi:hypothetical protein
LALERDRWRKIVEEAKAYLRAVEPREEEAYIIGKDKSLGQRIHDFNYNLLTRNYQPVLSSDACKQNIKFSRHVDANYTGGVHLNSEKLSRHNLKKNSRHTKICVKAKIKI